MYYKLRCSSITLVGASCGMFYTMIGGIFMKKRRWASLFLAVLMACSMVLSSLPAQALADDADNESSFAAGDDEVTSEDSGGGDDEAASEDSGDGDDETAGDAEDSNDDSVELTLVDGVTHVTVHDPSIVKGYVAESVTAMSTSVEIVGAADDTHTKGVYFIFGSHLAWAYSWDMVNWTIFYNNINSDYSTLFANEFDWANNGDSAYAESGNMWAPDVIWNEAMGKWCMYMSINGCSWNSCICMLTADSLYGDWTYVGPVVYSGFNASGTYSYTYTDYADVTGDTSLPSRYSMSSYNCSDGSTTCEATTWNTSYGAHAIDPCVIYDEDGNLWMSYGSWSGGIYMIELDEATGLRDYTVTYDTVTNVSDAYMGYQIAGGKFVSGEASYIEYINGYYYLFVTYGGLTASGGYNMRLYRSTTINGGYVDESGDSAIYSTYEYNYTNTVGLRVMTYYKWSFQENAQVAQGHNSVYYDKDSGKIYLVYHRRTDNGTEWHEVRVHQMFLNEDGWLVTAPFEYTGETISDTGYDDSELVGTYEMLIQYQYTDYGNLDYSRSQYIKLEADGTVSGAMSGTWTTTDDSPYVTMKLNGEAYKGVFLEQQIEGVYASAMTFTVLGEDNETYLWGYQCGDTTATVGSKTGSTVDTLTWNDLRNFYMISAAEGDFTMEWTFTNENQGSSSAWYCNYILCVTTDQGMYKTWTSDGDWSLRADAYSNTTFAGSSVDITYDWAWDDFSAIMNGAEAQATLTRIGTTMTYSAVITGSDGNEYHYTAVVTDAPEDAVTVYLGGENCYLEIETVSISVEDTTTAPTTHTWDEGTVTTAATCTTAGTMTYTCTDEGCTETKTVMIPATGHSYVAQETVAPTCTEKGYTVYECSVCSNTIKSDYVDALGHTWELIESVESTSQTKGHKTYKCSVCEETYTTELAIPLDICTVSVEDSYSYTGSAIKPVTVTDGSKTLTSGTDYTIKYSGNTDVGTATYTITGTGDYEGTVTGSFAITQVDAQSNLTITLSSSSYTYNGSAKKPAVTVKNASGTTISGSKYSVSYSNNTNAGTATVTVTLTDSTLKKNYSGTATKTFTISKASQSISVSSSGSSSIKAGKTTTWTAKTSGDGAITYSTSDSSIATVNSSGKVTGKGVGTVTIYAKAASTSNYNASSKTKIATITVGLTTPTISSVVQSNTTVTVKWTGVTGAKGYYVYRKVGSGSYSLVKTISSTSTGTITYKDTTSKTNGKKYYYRVYAYSGSTKSSASSAKSLTYMKGTVSSLTNTSSGITVKWSKVSGATGYYVYRKASTASKYTKVKTITKSSTVSWTDTGVKSKNGTTYTYYVQPYNSTSKGAYATKKIVRMTAVSLSSVKNSSSKKMTVKWAKNSKATGYQIQYSTSSSFASGNKTVTVSGAASTSKVISSLTKGKTYYVRIRTYKTVSGTKYYSAWSSKKSVKISK